MVIYIIQKINIEMEKLQNWELSNFQECVNMHQNQERFPIKVLGASCACITKNDRK